MLFYAAIFFILAAVSAIIGFVLGAAAAKILFFVFLMLGTVAVFIRDKVPE